MKPTNSDFQYLEMTEDQLLIAIGNGLMQDSFGSKPASDLEKRQIASRWFDTHIPQLRATICDNQAIRSQLGPKAQDRNGLFVLLFDVVFTAHFGVPAGALTATILKMGIVKLCPEWK